MQTAAALTDAPTSLDPYGQLIKMLLPRANAIAIYDRLGVALWASDGFDDPDLHRVLQDSIASELADTAPVTDGFVVNSGSEQATYVFALRDASRILLGLVGLVSRESNRQPRPFSLVHGLLRPALECLERELDVAVEHRRPAAQSRRARQGPGVAVGRCAGRIRERRRHR